MDKDKVQHIDGPTTESSWRCLNEEKYNVVVIEDSEPSYNNLFKKVHIVKHSGFINHIPITLENLGFDLNKIKYHIADTIKQ